MLRDRGGGVLVRAECRLPEIYLVLALVVCGVMCFVTAPFFGPDEPAQSSRAIALGHGMVVAHAEKEEPGAELDDGFIGVIEEVDESRTAWEKDAGFFLDRRHGVVSDEGQRKLAGVRWVGRRSFEPFGNTAVYPPGLYLPAMVGWRVGEASGVTIFGTLRLARMLCALTAVGMGWLALRICVGWRWPLLAYLILPSVVFLDATSSQDPVMLGAAAVIAALVSRAMVERREFAGWELVVAAGLLGIVGMSRPPYLAMGLVLFLPAVELRLGWVKPAVAFGVMVAAAGVWWRMMAGLGIDHSDAAEPGMQRAFLLGHPVMGGVAIMRGTWEAAGDFVRRGLYVVGWNDLLPHHGAALVLGVCLGVMVVWGPRVEIRTGRGLGLLAVGVVGAVVGVSVAEYLIWTRVGWGTVWGIQPRYWLPVMPLGMMLLQGCLRVRSRVGLAAGVAGVMGVVVCTLPWMAAHAFYGEGLGRVLGLNLR
jgi:hypothetical protein